MKREDSKPFSLTMTQAQALYSLLCCWSTPKKRQQARNAVRRFSRQLDDHYQSGNYEIRPNGKVLPV